MNNMKSYPLMIFFLACLFQSSSTYAWHSVEGVVSDLTGKKLPDVKVELRTTNRRTIDTTYTSDSGHFYFSKVNVGTYELYINADGYREFSERVDYLSNTPQNYYEDISLIPLASTLGDASGGKLDEFFNPPSVKIRKKALKLFRKAITQKELKNRDKATEMLEKAIKEDPDFARAYSELAELQLEMDQLDQAEKNLTKALQLNEFDPHPLVRRAWLQHEKNMWAEAEETLMKALKLDPDRPETFTALGINYFNQKKYSKAIENLENALSLNPFGNHKAVIYLGRIFEMRKDYRSARRTYKNFIDKNPTDENLEEIQELLTEVKNKI